MTDDLAFFVFLLVAAAFLAGVYGERWRARRARRRWQEKNGIPVTDPADQLRIVMDSSFEKRRILSHAEARLLFAAERAVSSANRNWRVMAQVSLGEILSSPDRRAYSTINSKRVDLLIISGKGEPLVAIEYQGGGHYQRNAAARDAVKKEALRKAGIRYIEMTPQDGAGDLEREILRLADRGKVTQLKPAPRTA